MSTSFLGCDVAVSFCSLEFDQLREFNLHYEWAIKDVGAASKRLEEELRIVCGILLSEGKVRERISQHGASVL